jgi:epoxyqueuosine reductase
MNKIDRQQAELTALLKANGASLVGFGDLSDIDPRITYGFTTAISLVIHYDDRIIETLDVNEALFHDHLWSLNDPLMKMVGLAERCLEAWGYRCKSIAIPSEIKSNRQLDELNQFPHKTAATRAGLGWIGKSSLLITPEYGPRVKLYTILTNAEFAKAKPINDNKCGGCQQCVAVCPSKAIKNVGWQVGIGRNELINVYDCNDYRLSFEPTMGRKHSCGLCVKACRVGLGTED